MNNSTKLMLKYSVGYGIILGAILIIWLTFDYVMGYYGQNKTLSNLNYVARIAGIFFCVLIYRNKVKDGYISFEEAFLFGLSLFIVAMLLLEIYVCLLINLVDPNYLIVKADMMTKQLTAVGMEGERIGRIKDVAIQMQYPVRAVIIAVLGGAFVGAIASAVIALLLKREPKKSKTYNRRKMKF